MNAFETAFAEMDKKRGVLQKHMERHDKTKEDLELFWKECEPFESEISQILTKVEIRACGENKSIDYVLSMFGDREKLGEFLNLRLGLFEVGRNGLRTSQIYRCGPYFETRNGIRIYVVQAR